MKNLLTLTFRYYAALAGLLWLLSIPLSFVLIRHLVVQDVDEALLSRKSELSRLLPVANSQLLRYLPYTDSNVHLTPSRTPALPDRLYDTVYYLPYLHEWEPHRELASSLRIGGQPYRLLIRQSLVESDDFIMTITGLQTGIFMLLLLGLGVINRQTTRRLWHPFTDALHRIRQFRLEADPTPVWPATQVAEFGELHRALGSLISRNQAAYASQKQFAENASHEMQTPVAVILAQLELLFQTETRSEADLIHVQQAADAARRLAHINRALLLLTQIENQQFAEAQPVSLGTVLAKLLTANTDFIQHKALVVHHTQVGNSQVLMNLHLAEVLLGNLLRNAIRHAPVGGSLTCAVTAASVTIANTGEPLPFPAETLFDRFVKNPALPDATGLGLAIARQIATRYGLSLSYTYDADKKEHEFRLELAGSV